MWRRATDRKDLKHINATLCYRQDMIPNATHRQHLWSRLMASRRSYQRGVVADRERKMITRELVAKRLCVTQTGLHMCATCCVKAVRTLLVPGCASLLFSTYHNFLIASDPLPPSRISPSSSLVGSAKTLRRVSPLQDRSHRITQIPTESFQNRPTWLLCGCSCAW